ncbi:hypothetical protein RDWZM_008862 [Blomia tropicalis]|uniref:Uncharacterized protein n=1 Tax=Blomia tropicalis TaxID=40697 RepID=A0A9Q0RKS4_BLOTA|nr:hypothetical protein RDWZM_008862 [Blomia tropicalis]
MPRSNRSRRGNPDDEQPEEMENSRNITINITEKLKGADNWTSWKRQVKAHLLRLRAIKAIEEEIPDESLKNADALSLIIGSIEQNLLLQIPESSSAFHTWKSLGERFDVKHHASLFNLIGELKTIVWNRTENIEDHLNKLKRIFIDINSSENMLPEETFVLFALQSINDQLHYVKIALASKDKLTIDNVFPNLIAEASSGTTDLTTTSISHFSNSRQTLFRC